MKMLLIVHSFYVDEHSLFVTWQQMWLSMSSPWWCEICVSAGVPSACLIAWCIIHAPVMDDDMRDDVSAWYILCPSSHSFAWQDWLARGLESIKFPPPRYRLLPNPPSRPLFSVALSVFKSIAGALCSINEGDCLVSTYDRGKEEALSDDIRGPMLAQTYFDTALTKWLNHLMRTALSQTVWRWSLASGIKASMRCHLVLQLRHEYGLVRATSHRHRSCFQRNSIPRQELRRARPDG